MTLTLGAFLLISVSLSALAQIVMKYGMSAPTIQTAFHGADRLTLAWSIGSSPGVLAGLALYVLSVAFWLHVLAKLDVSQAYPFVGLGFLITMLFGFLFLGEPLSMQKVLGTALVATGVFLVAKA